MDPGQPAVSIAVMNAFCKKSLLCICWDIKGILHYKLMKNDEAVIAACYLKFECCSSRRKKAFHKTRELENHADA